MPTWKGHSYLSTFGPQSEEPKQKKIVLSNGNKQVLIGISGDLAVTYPISQKEAWQTVLRKRQGYLFELLQLKSSRHFDKWGKYHCRTLYTNELSYFIKFMDDDFLFF